jgi:hypothetical protein
VAVGLGHRRRQVASRGHHYRGPFVEVGRRARPRRGWSRRHQVASVSVDAAATRPRRGERESLPSSHFLVVGRHCCAPSSEWSAAARRASRLRNPSQTRAARRIKMKRTC